VTAFENNPVSVTSKKYNKLYNSSYIFYSNLAFYICDYLVI